MKLRLPLLLAGALAALLATQNASSTTTVRGDYWDLIFQWETDSDFQLVGDISPDESKLYPDENTGRFEASLKVTPDRTITLDGGYGDNQRHGFVSDEIVTRYNWLITRAFIVEGGNLSVKNTQFIQLSEINQMALDPDYQLKPEAPKTRAQTSGGIIPTLHSCGGAIFASTNESVTQLENCFFQKNSVAWYTEDDDYNLRPDIPVEGQKRDVVQISGGAVGGKGLFNITKSTFDSNNAKGNVWSYAVSATASGGAILASNLILDDSKFTSNQAIIREVVHIQTPQFSESTELTARGGAIVAESTGEKISITNVTFSSNNAQVTGVTPDDSTIIHKTNVLAEGGALVVSGNDVTIDNCTFTGNYARATGTNATARGGAGTFSTSAFVTNSTFLRNSANALGLTTTDGSIYLSSVSNGWGGAAFGGNFDNCTFTSNGAGAGKAEHSSSLGGAIYTNSSIIKNSSFTNNYAAAATVSKGGAIYLTPNGDNFSLDIIADQKSSEFKGNRTNVTRLDMYSKPTDGTANSIYIDAASLAGKNSSFDLRASAGLSVSFYDPVVVDAKGTDMEMSFNRPSSSKFSGKIVFTGEAYADSKNDADFMSRIQANTVMKQYEGEVVITKKAILGANMSSTTIAEAKSQPISNYGYSLRKGTLTITEQGGLIAGGFMVGTNSGLENEGWKNCKLSVGSGASLITEWVRIDQGVSFDLVNFYLTHDSGLYVDLTTGGLTMGSTGDYFKQSDNGLFILGGQLGLSDSMAMYKNVMWKTDQEFLLLDLSETAETAFGKTTEEAMNGQDAFSGIVSNTTGSNEVKSELVYSGTWSQVWKDTNNDGKADELYAVWTADGNHPIPEPSSAILALGGLAGLLVRRKRR